MKLRIRGDTLRLRLKRGEVQGASRFLEIQMLIGWHEIKGPGIAGHAITTAQIAPVRDRNTQILQRTVQGIAQGARALNFGRFVAERNRKCVKATHKSP